MLIGYIIAVLIFLLRSAWFFVTHILIFGIFYILMRWMEHKYGGMLIDISLEHKNITVDGLLHFCYDAISMDKMYAYNVVGNFTRVFL